MIKHPLSLSIVPFSLFVAFLILYFSETLIRTAFQSLQLVVTDFLPIMPSFCLQVSVEVASKFGLQNQELNISLTAIGLLVRRNYQDKSSIIIGRICFIYLV